MKGSSEESNVRTVSITFKFPDNREKEYDAVWDRITDHPKPHLGQYGDNTDPHNHSLPSQFQRRKNLNSYRY